MKNHSIAKRERGKHKLKTTRQDMYQCNNGQFHCTKHMEITRDRRERVLKPTP
jgi:hypothetical protein